MHMSTIAEKLVKIGQVCAEIFSGRTDFCPLVQKGAVVTLAVSGVTGPILSKLAYEEATIFSLNIFTIVSPPNE